MEFVKVKDQYINFGLVKYVQITKEGLEIFIDDSIIAVTDNNDAKYLREVLDGAMVATVAEINRKLPVKGANL